MLHMANALGNYQGMVVEGSGLHSRLEGYGVTLCILSCAVIRI